MKSDNIKKVQLELPQSIIDIIFEVSKIKNQLWDDTLYDLCLSGISNYFPMIGLFLDDQKLECGDKNKCIQSFYVEGGKLQIKPSVKRRYRNKKVKVK